MTFIKTRFFFNSVLFNFFIKSKWIRSHSTTFSSDTVSFNKDDEYAHKFTLLWMIATFARGENVKLFLVDSGLDHEYVRPTKGDNWAEKKAELQRKGNKRGTLPYVEMGDKVLSGTVPILRYLSAKLGKYDGSNAEEKYFVDSVTDSAEDWFHSFVNGLKGGEVKQNYI